MNLAPAGEILIKEIPGTFLCSTRGWGTGEWMMDYNVLDGSQGSTTWFLQPEASDILVYSTWTCR
jgi:hypothetical protein